LELHDADTVGCTAYLTEKASNWNLFAYSVLRVVRSRQQLLIKAVAAGNWVLRAENKPMIGNTGWDCQTVEFDPSESM
jgi:hypothetical protein